MPRTPFTIEQTIRHFYSTCVQYDEPLCAAWTASSILQRTSCVVEDGTDLWKTFEFQWSQKNSHKPANHPLVIATLRMGLKLCSRNHDLNSDLVCFDLWSVPFDGANRAEAAILELLDFCILCQSPHHALLELERALGFDSRDTNAAETILVESITNNATPFLFEADCFCVAIALLLYARRVTDRVAFVLESTILASCVRDSWPAREWFLEEVVRVHDHLRMTVPVLPAASDLSPPTPPTADAHEEARAQRRSRELPLPEPPHEPSEGDAPVTPPRPGAV